MAVVPVPLMLSGLLIVWLLNHIQGVADSDPDQPHISRSVEPRSCRISGSIESDCGPSRFGDHVN